METRRDEIGADDIRLDQIRREEASELLHWSFACFKLLKRRPGRAFMLQRKHTSHRGNEKRAKEFPDTAVIQILQGTNPLRGHGDSHTHTHTLSMQQQAAAEGASQ